ncbi:hypothetical protein HED51_13745 [Ochrobactrum grignonense]|nr:hypothetical protein [Brucella grignonensis]
MSAVESMYPQEWLWQKRFAGQLPVLRSIGTQSPKQAGHNVTLKVEFSALLMYGNKMTSTVIFYNDSKFQKRN